MAVVRCQPAPPSQQLEFDQESASDDFAPEPLDRLDRSRCRAAGGDQIVVDQDPGAVRERVGVDFELVRPILEFVLDRDRLSRQLSGLSRRYEAGPDRLGQRSPEDETPGFGRDHQIDTQRPGIGGQLRGDLSRRLRHQQQRRDVPENDPFLGEVGNVSDQTGEVHALRIAATRRRPGASSRVAAVGHHLFVDYGALELCDLLLTHEEAIDLKAHGKREAAVLLPITNWSHDPRLVFTERRADLNKHAGEISFPGGMSEPDDGNLARTALRESHEEINLRPERVEVVGALAPVGTFVTSYRIQPYVGLVTGDEPLEANPDEVASILHFGIDELVDSYAMRRLVRRGVPIRTPTFDVGRHMIWGATARILTDFLSRIRAFV